MTQSIQSLGGDSPSQDQPVCSQPTSSEGANQPAPSESGNLASASNDTIHGRKPMREMANKIWHILCPCFSGKEGNIVGDADGNNNGAERNRNDNGSVINDISAHEKNLEDAGRSDNRAERNIVRDADGRVINDTSGHDRNIFKDDSGNETERLINDINQLLNLIREGKPTTGYDCQWPDRLSKLLLFLSTGRKTNTSGPVLKNLSEVTTAVKDLLEIIGCPSFVTAGFFVIAYGLKRFQNVSDNKEECLSILEELNNLNKLVKQCTEREKLKEGMEVQIKAATELIIDGIVKCLSQIKSSPFSKLFKASVNNTELRRIKEDINHKQEAIRWQLEFSISDALLKEPRLSREAPKHAVGITKSVKEVTDLLEWGTEIKSVAVILYGFGGMGKTTVADAVFNRVNINVDGKEGKYVHVELFKSVDSIPDIVELQKKILEDLRGSKNFPEIRKYQDGQEQIRIALEEVPALIYIDNVLEKDKLRQLLPLNFDTAKKVRLLITARDINVRIACQMKTPPKEYRMRCISSADALTLLKNQISSDEILSSIPFNHIIDKCGGIPLMLHLVAQKLSSAKDKQEVREVLEELEKLEGEEFGAKLESHFFVYDKLPEECKESFLDICSVFKGWDWDTVADIMGKTALDMLERRALVAKGTNGVVTGHDVIMEVGRRKAKGTRVRLIETSQLLNFPEDDDKVERLRYLRSEPANDLSQLIRMPPNLKYMEIDGKLQCDNLEIFPTWLMRLSDLRILKLINFGGLKELPSVLGDRVKGLRELTLSKCKSFKELPYSISKLRSLRVLKMDHCQYLAQLPKDFGSLNSLEILSITYCDSLKVLPDNFGELSSLRVLNLSFCKALEHLPDDLGKITSLVKLDVSHCSNLISIPKTIGELKSLLSMDISWCSCLEELPNEFCTPSMTYLKLTRCIALKNLPDQFDKLKSLRVLKLKSCTSLEKLPEAFSQLKYLVHLDLSGCTELQELCTDFKALSTLRTLSLDGCKKLKKLPENFHHLYSLQHLNLCNCEVLEGESMNNVVETEGLEIVYITKSHKLEHKWNEIKGQRDEWSLQVDIGQVLTPDLTPKENKWEELSSEFDRLLQNGKGESFHLSQLSLNTILLVMFDGHLDFNQAFPWPLIEETIDDIKINFEIIYIGKHFNKLPKRVADRILGSALDNSDTRLLLEKVFFTIKGNGENLWHQKMNKFFVMSTEIMEKTKMEGRVGEIGDKYLSRWTLLSDCQMEKFLLEKCGRYLWLKQIAEKKQESSIQLLRELIENEGEDISLWMKSHKVGLDELGGKTILLEIRPANASYDIRLQPLKDMYIREKERSNLEIISIPVGQPSIKLEQFSGDIPWLVLRNSWTMTRAVKYFLITECQWKDKDGENSESYYPSRFLKIELNRKITCMPVLRMLERWGAKSYPFSAENIKVLKEEEKNHLKRMSSLKFLFKPLMGEIDEEVMLQSCEGGLDPHMKEVMTLSEKLKKVMLQRKMICLLCDGRDPDTMRVRTGIFVSSVKSALTDAIHDIHFIYVPHHAETKEEKLIVTDKIHVAYFPLQESKTPKLPPQNLLSLPQWAAMRFRMRVGDLRKEIKGMDHRLLDSLDPKQLFMAFIDEDGEVVTTKGREIADIFDNTKDTAKGPANGEAKKVERNKDEARKLVEDMIKGSKEQRKDAALKLESMC